MGPTPSAAFASLWMVHSVGVLRLAAKTALGLPGSLTIPFSYVPCSQTPPESPATSPIRSPTIAFQVFDPVGLRVIVSRGSIASLALRPICPLSTLDPRRCLRGAKTRFAVRWLLSFCGGNLTRWNRQACPGAPKKARMSRRCCCPFSAPLNCAATIRSIRSCSWFKNICARASL